MAVLTIVESGIHSRIYVLIRVLQPKCHRAVPLGRDVRDRGRLRCYSALLQGVQVIELLFDIFVSRNE